MAYGMAGMPGNQRQVGLPRGMSGFPVVGRGLGGLPVRVTALVVPQTYFAAQFGTATDYFGDSLVAPAVLVDGSVFAFGRSAPAASTSSHLIVNMTDKGVVNYTRRNKGASTTNMYGIRSAVYHAGKIYVGGNFDSTSYPGCIGRLDPVTGASEIMYTWGTSTPKTIKTVLALGSSIYSCGTHSSGPTQGAIGKYDADLVRTAEVSFRVSGGGAAAAHTMVTDGTHLYVLGYMVDASPNYYSYILKVSPTDLTLITQYGYLGLDPYAFDSGVCSTDGFIYTWGENKLRKIRLSDGVMVWSRGFSGITLAANNGKAGLIAQDTSGNLYVLISSSTLPRDVYVAKVTSDGVLLWTTLINFAPTTDMGLAPNAISVLNGALYISLVASIQNGGDAGVRTRGILVKLKLDGTSAMPQTQRLTITPGSALTSTSPAVNAQGAFTSSYGTSTSAGYITNSMTNEAVVFTEQHVTEYL